MKVDNTLDASSFCVLLIPAYQPSHILVELVERVISHADSSLFLQIIIVNDGSSAASNMVFDRLAVLPTVTILRHAVNLGKGAALKTGFNFALINYPTVNAVVTADADGQHEVEDIYRVAKRSLTHKQSLILGSRHFTGNVPARSLFGNKLTRLVVRFFTGLQVTDSQTGLRAWPKELAAKSLKTTINGYDFEMDCLVRAKQLVNKLDIKEVKISTIYLENNQSSHFNPLLDSMRIYFVFVRYCASGLFTALTDNVIFAFCFFATNNLLASQAISRVSGAAVSFTLNYTVVFKNSTNLMWSLSKFLFFCTLFGMISFGLIHFFTHSFGFDVLASKLLAEFFLFILSFVIQRSLIFSESTD